MEQPGGNPAAQNPCQDTANGTARKVGPGKSPGQIRSGGGYRQRGQADGQDDGHGHGEEGVLLRLCQQCQQRQQEHPAPGTEEPIDRACAGPCQGISPRTLRFHKNTSCGSFRHRRCFYTWKLESYRCVSGSDLFNGTACLRPQNDRAIQYAGRTCGPRGGYGVTVRWWQR